MLLSEGIWAQNEQRQNKSLVDSVVVLVSWELDTPQKQKKKNQQADRKGERASEQEEMRTLLFANEWARGRDASGDKKMLASQKVTETREKDWSDSSSQLVSLRGRLTTSQARPQTDYKDDQGRGKRQAS